MSAIRRAMLLSETAVTQMINAIETGPFAGPIAARDRALLELLYGSGVRVSEAVGLDVADVDLQEGTACVLGKGGHMRVVPLTRHATRALRSCITWRREGPVFRKRCGQRMGARLARKVVEKYARLAGAPHSSPHTLRHTCASHMLKNGAYLFHVQQLLGHQRADTTTKYLHRMPHGLSATADHRQTHPRA